MFVIYFCTNSFNWLTNLKTGVVEKQRLLLEEDF